MTETAFHLLPFVVRATGGEDVTEALCARVPSVHAVLACTGNAMGIGARAYGGQQPREDVACITERGPNEAGASGRGVPLIANALATYGAIAWRVITHSHTSLAQSCQLASRALGCALGAMDVPMATWAQDHFRVRFTNLYGL